MRDPEGYSHEPGTAAVVAGDDAGKVSSVTVRIQIPQLIRLRFEGKIRAVDYLAIQAGDGHDSRVDQRNIDPLAVVPLDPEGIGTNGVLHDRLQRAPVVVHPARRYVGGVLPPIL